MSLASRLTRLDKNLAVAEQEKYAEHSGGITLRAMVDNGMEFINEPLLT